ncbi:alginate export family protein [Thiomicrorhabdus indica]|uniref:alginate export family protein n=1 Tax=Thiomicrorhabdus indica TaxID=2267253 RepID=UPI00102D8152|nr:alginate export family protein [Thiomicrorhabdus indica]
MKTLSPNIQILFLSSGLFLSNLAHANTELFVEIRERAEHQENLNDKFYGNHPKVGEASDSYLLSRIRVGLDHQFSEHLKGRISLQDSRVLGWGFDDKNWVNSEFGGIENNPQSDPMELGETWLQYQAGAVTTKVGRQAIFYGNKRVFGPGAWKNSGKWVWDAAKVRFKHEKHWVDAFYGKTMLHDPNEFSLEHGHGFTGKGLYGHLKASENLVIEPMLFTKFNDDSNDYLEKDLYYYGTRAVFKDYGFKVDATYLLQKGDILKTTSKSVDVDAYGYNLDINYRLSPKWMLGATHAFATGDDKSTPENERFDGAYGASDKYYGRMNLMGWSNIADYGFLLNYRPHRDWEFQAEYHQFYADVVEDSWRAYKAATATAANNPLKSSSDHYGNEIDLTAVYKMNKQWNFQAGLGVFMPGEAIKQSVANGTKFLTDDTAYSGFFQVQYKFKHAL